MEKKEFYKLTKGQNAIKIITVSSAVLSSAYYFLYWYITCLCNWISCC
jgi:hypothetical protein